MKKINNISKDLKKKILEFLYKDEMYNAILIEIIEHYKEDLGELYINKTKGVITEVLHIKKDGNSDYTSFSYSSEEGLKIIASVIRELSYEKILLSGKLEDVNKLLNILGHKKLITPNAFYKLDIDEYKSIDIRINSKTRLARIKDEEIEKIKRFTLNFFEAESEDETKNVSNTERILEKIKKGIYLLEYKNTIVGMARFIGKTNKFAEITGVYIDTDHRNKGLGKELISHLIDIAIKEQKTPVLVTSSTNVAAKKTYESLGFKKQEAYAYEFLC